MLMKHEAFVKTAGYSAKEVIDTFGLPQKAVDLLAPYWIYVGAPLSILPFTIWAVLMADYVGYGSKVPKKLSHEMSLKMQERAEEMGVQVELKQPVEKILVRDGKAYGVRTKRGDEIHADYVISAAYPNKVYTSMIEPADAVPDKAIKMVNGRRIGLTAFTVFLLLDKSAEELGITDYNVFLGETMDTDKIFENYKGTGPYNYLTTICLNHRRLAAGGRGRDRQSEARDREVHGGRHEQVLRRRPAGARAGSDHRDAHDGRALHRHVERLHLRLSAQHGRPHRRPPADRRG